MNKVDIRIETNLELDEVLEHLQDAGYSAKAYPVLQINIPLSSGSKWRDEISDEEFIGLLLHNKPIDRFDHSLVLSTGTLDAWQVYGKDLTDAISATTRSKEMVGEVVVDDEGVEILQFTRRGPE